MVEWIRKIKTYKSDGNYSIRKCSQGVLPSAFIFSVCGGPIFFSLFHSCLLFVCAILTIQLDLFCLNLLLRILRDFFFFINECSITSAELLYAIRCTPIESIRSIYIVFALWNQSFLFVNAVFVATISSIYALYTERLFFSSLSRFSFIRARCFPCVTLFVAVLFMLYQFEEYTIF